MYIVELSHSYRYRAGHTPLRFCYRRALVLHLLVQTIGPLSLDKAKKNLLPMSAHTLPAGPKLYDPCPLTRQRRICCRGALVLCQLVQNCSSLSLDKAEKNLLPRSARTSPAGPKLYDPCPLTTQTRICCQ